MERKRLKDIRKSRSIGHRPKRNKKTVAKKRCIRLGNDKLLNEYFHKQQNR